MINTQINFEAKILNGSKVIIFTRNYIKFFDQFDLKNQGQGRHFLKIQELKMINTQL